VRSSIGRPVHRPHVCPEFRLMIRLHDRHVGPAPDFTLGYANTDCSPGTQGLCARSLNMPQTDGIRWLEILLVEDNDVQDWIG